MRTRVNDEDAPGLLRWAALALATMTCWLSSSSIPEPALVQWIRTGLNLTGETVTMYSLYKLTPPPIRNHGEDDIGKGRDVNSGLTFIGMTYAARWIIERRDIYVVDAIPLRSIIPLKEAIAVAGYKAHGVLLTREELLPNGRLRIRWMLCGSYRCALDPKAREQLQPGAEFQGRLEASARFPSSD